MIPHLSERGLIVAPLGRDSEVASRVLAENGVRSIVCLGLGGLVEELQKGAGFALVTEEATAPGFYHNLHSINHFHISETPWFKDLNLGDRVEYITPRYEFGQPHLDGSALIFGRDLEETLANVGRFSKKDAMV